MLAPNSGDRKRLAVVALGLFTLFSILIAQFYKIQIIEGEKWTKAANAQHQLVVVEPFQRGLFYSNTSIKKGHPDEVHPFVVAIPLFHLFIDPLSISEECRNEMTEKLGRFLRVSGTDKDKLRAQFDKHSHSRKLMMWVGKEKRDEVLKWWFDYARQKKLVRNALYFTQDYKRSYPYGKLLGQVLHTVREGSIPTGGLEMAYNKVLNGKPGKRKILRSPRHPLDMGKIIDYPENGADVYLTINHYLQAIAEEEIEKAVKNANAKGGWAILMQPRTGEILALAQYPFFDPSAYAKYYNNPALRDCTKVKAVTDAFEPGSTMKPLTIAICLKANKELVKRGQKPLFSPEEKVETANGHFPGRSKLIKDLRTHKYLNMYMAMQKSSDVYMARMIQRVIERLGADWYRNALQETFGFGIKTHIELPSETPGMLPKPGKKYANGALQWSVPTPFSLSYGYNLLVNSIQMLRSHAVLANGGYEVEPTLIKKIVKKDRDGVETVLVDHTSPERIKKFKRVLDDDIIKEVVRSMRFVTKPGGSAAKAGLPGYTSVGKTGTAEKVVGKAYSTKIHFTNFIGFAPISHPEFVLLIGIDEPEYKYIPGVGKNHLGGQCCAPAFKEIGLRTLEYLGVEPDDPKNVDWLKECSDLKSRYQEWNGK